MLTPFEFSVPTKIIFGVGEVKKVGGEAARYGKKGSSGDLRRGFCEKGSAFSIRWPTAVRKRAWSFCTISA